MIVGGRFIRPLFKIKRNQDFSLRTQPMREQRSRSSGRLDAGVTISYHNENTHSHTHEVLCVVAPSGTGKTVFKEVCWAKCRAPFGYMLLSQCWWDWAKRTLLQRGPTALSNIRRWEKLILNRSWHIWLWLVKVNSQRSLGKNKIDSLRLTVGKRSERQELSTNMTNRWWKYQKHQTWDEIYTVQSRDSQLLHLYDEHTSHQRPIYNLVTFNRARGVFSRHLFMSCIWLFQL